MQRAVAGIGGNGSQFAQRAQVLDATGLGIATGIDIDQLVDAAGWISDVLGRKPVSRTGNALLAKRASREAAAA